jgi:phage baseplate assembly protein gpV
MSMAKLANAIRQQARASQNEFTTPRLATISSYDASNHAVKVIDQPVDPEVGEIESNWMPLGAIGIGNGWGVAVGPQINDQVLVVYENGDFSSGTIVARIFSVEQQAIPVPPGEIWAIHQTTSSLKFLTNGDVDINAAGNLNATVAGNMAANVTGNMTSAVTGDATTTAANASVTATGTATVSAPSISLKNSGAALKSLLNSLFSTWAAGHVHSNGNGGANTGVPTVPPPANTQTSIVQAE